MSAPSSDPFLAFGERPEQLNIAAALLAGAEGRGDQDAVREAKSGRALCFRDLVARSDALAHGLARADVRRGDRVALFVRAGVDLIAVTFALFRLGAVPVLIDPGMGRENLLACVERMRPRVMLAVPTAHMARLLFWKAFRSVEVLITVGRPKLWGGHRLERLEARGARDGTFRTADTRRDEEAAVLFTSGSTGPPKGVAYTHGMFHAQLHALRALYDLRPGEVDVACFPLFALFDAGLGITSVFPDLDPSRPGQCEPERVHRALAESEATLTFGSPAIWRRVLPWCIERGLTLPHLRRALIAGAPVPPALVEAFRRVLPAHGDVFTPYGATESLPVASIAGAEILALRARSESGGGTCVGATAPGIDLRLIRVTDDALARFDPALEVARGELGEICVRGPVVTHEYKFEPGPTRAAKIPGARPGDVWHRLGDLGYLDEAGRLWFCGRKSHRLQTAAGLVPPVPTENVFNTHPDVKRTALVGLGAPGHEVPVLLVEPERTAGARVESELARELQEYGRARGVTLAIEHVAFPGEFPVDVRHNAKIERGRLKRWAEQELG